MLAYQQIPQNFDSNRNRSTSPNHKDSKDYIRQIRRRSLSRSSSPVRSHSPIFMKTSERHLIKRSVSEEDLRLNHERRRLSIESEHLVIRRPSILVNYQELKDENDDNTAVEEQPWLPNDEPDEETPLDLSMGSKKRRDRVNSGTESDDSTELGDELGGRGNEGRAYKKSLMKRYCKFTLNASNDDLILRRKGFLFNHFLMHLLGVGKNKKNPSDVYLGFWIDFFSMSHYSIKIVYI